MKNKLGILVLLVGMAIMSILCWNGIKQVGLTSQEADSMNLASDFSHRLFNSDDYTSQIQFENTRFIYFGIGLMALLLIFRITSNFEQRPMISVAIFLSGTSIAWAAVFQHISLLAFPIFSVLILQWAFIFIYPKAEKSGIIIYSVIAILSLLLSPVADFLIAIHVLLIIIKLVSRYSITFSKLAQLIIISIVFLPFWVWQTKNIPGNYSIKDLIFICPLTIIFAAWIISFLLKFVFDFIYKIKSKMRRVTLLGLCYFIVATLLFLWVSFQYKTYYINLNKNIENNLLSGINFISKVVKNKDKLLVISKLPIKKNPRFKYYLPEFIESHPNISISKITPRNWRNYQEIIENFTNKNIWIISSYFQKPDFSKTSEWKYADFQFATPVGLIKHSSNWSRIDHYKILQKAKSVAPDNIKINRELLFWYIKSPSSQLAYNLRKGYALKDLSVNPTLEKMYGYWHHAVINTLYAWSDIGVEEYNITNYSAYNNFILGTQKAGLDIERAVYIYRIYATKMLENNMPEESEKITNDSKLLEKENSFIKRISAQIQQKFNPDNYKKIEELNTKAIKLHKEKFSETFLDAGYANAILKMKQAEYDAALKEIMNLLDFVKSSKFIPLNIKTNNSEKGILQQKFWLQKQLDREGQFNAFIARIYNNKGDSKTAIEWYSKNTSEKFNRERNLIARRKIAGIHEKNGELKDAYAQFRLLANNSTSITEKVGFLIDGAQLYINDGDSITVYDKYLELKDIIFKLPSDAKSKWRRNKKYQRIVSHLQSRMQLDIREQIIIELSKKAALTNSGWYLQQIGQLSRCKQQYDNAEKSFEEGMKKETDYIGNYLDGAMLQYKLLRFKKAHKIFNDLEQRMILSNSLAINIADWRYQILKSFVEQEKPPVAISLIEWSDNNKFEFENLAKYHNFRGNIYSSYNEFELATNEFHKGITTNEFYLENYLDLGYQLCLKNDAENANILLDKIFKLDIDENIKNKINDDWRFIQLDFITVTH